MQNCFKCELNCVNSKKKPTEIANIKRTPFFIVSLQSPIFIHFGTLLGEELGCHNDMKDCDFMHNIS